MSCLIKLFQLPLYLPFYFLWALLGRLLGGKNRIYDIWRW